MLLVRNHRWEKEIIVKPKRKKNINKLFTYENSKSEQRHNIFVGLGQS